eukprot:scaffold89636_cov20-Tisochrysis_lutea.AAC.8
MQVSILRVDCLQLKASLVPAPTRSLEQLHALIPALASDLFQSFMGEVQVRAVSLVLVFWSMAHCIIWTLVKCACEGSSPGMQYEMGRQLSFLLVDEEKKESTNTDRVQTEVMLTCVLRPQLSCASL